MLSAYAMNRVAAGAHLPSPWLFEPAKRPDDRTDYCLDNSRLLLKITVVRASLFIMTSIRMPTHHNKTDADASSSHYQQIVL